jgi:hypothetical protein
MEIVEVPKFFAIIANTIICHPNQIFEVMSPDVDDWII